MLIAALLTGFVAGFAATPHCLGMCGGFPLHLAKSSERGNAAARQILFVTGKTFTYVFLGSLAAALGVLVFGAKPAGGGATALRIAAGVITVVFGLYMLGFRLPSIKFLQGISEAKLVRGLFGGLLGSPTPASAFVLGLGVGFLPCPLPTGMLLIASGSHSIPHGMALMAGVGLGTAPGLLALGLFGVGIDRKFARFGMKIAGLIVLIIGLLTIARATGLTHKTGHSAQPPCCCGSMTSNE
jgi:uncharacterized protein